MYCSRCGYELSDDARYCSRCGAPAPAVDAPAPSAIPTGPDQERRTAGTAAPDNDVHPAEPALGDIGSTSAGAFGAGSGAASPPQRSPASGLTADSFVYAGFWLRAFAIIVDLIVVALVQQVLLVPVGLSMGFAVGNSPFPAMHQYGMSGARGAFSIIVPWLYFTLFEMSTWRATPGKQLFDLQVVDLDGGNIGPLRANVRYWGKIVSAAILGIGFLMAGFTRRKQALHDKLAGTLVIRAE